MPDQREMKVADAGEVETLLDALAEKIARHATDQTALVGILRRGKPLADALAERIADRGGPRLEVGQLKLKRYSDRLELLHARARIDADSLDIDVRDRHLVLVDDVLYTGESMFSAACRLRTAGATRIQTAFLCARTGRTMPLHADFVGCRLEVQPDWVIHCEVPPYESELAIVIAHQSAIRGKR